MPPPVPRDMAAIRLREDVAREFPSPCFPSNRNHTRLKRPVKDKLPGMRKWQIFRCHRRLWCPTLCPDADA